MRGYGIYVAVVPNEISCVTSLLLEIIDCLFSAVYVDIPVRLCLDKKALEAETRFESLQGRVEDLIPTGE
jgi:hypothetical protein